MLLLPLEPVVPVGQAPGKRLCISQHKLCNSYHGLDPPMSVLWSIHDSASDQVSPGTPTLLHFSTIPGYGV